MNALRPLALLAVTVAGLLLVPPQKAHAGLNYISLGSGICKASNGLNTNLNYNLFAVRNISTVTQYVTCHVPFIREDFIGLLSGAGFSLNMLIGSVSSTPQTVTCTASVNHSNYDAIQSTKSVSVSSTAGGRLDWTPAELRAFTVNDSLSIYCGLAPKTSIGFVRARQPEYDVLIP